MINKAASGSGFTRKYDYRRYKLTIGYTLFFSFVLFGITFAISRFAAGSSGLLPQFMQTTVFGQLYLYNIVALALTAIGLIIFPKMMIFDDIPTNRWNLFFKSGISIGKLIGNKVLFCVSSILRVYAIGALGALLLGLLTKSGDTQAGILQWVLTFLLGICMLMTLIMPAVFFGSFLYNRFVLSAILLVSSLGIGFLLFSAGYITPADETVALQSMMALIRFSPTSLLIISIACSILFTVGAFMLASSKIKNYEIEELDDDELIQLGITKDIVVYERDEDDYEVAISGPEIFDVESSVPEPKFERTGTDSDDDDDDVPRKKKKEKKSKKEKKRNRRDDDDDDDDDDE